MKYLITLLFVSTTALANGTYDMAKNHGCNSAKADGGTWGYKAEKDIDRYIKDEYYKAGYDDGYKTCKAESDRIDDAIRGSMPIVW